jgi:hypothetical protein
MLTYNDITRDEGKLPEASRNALLARGFAHFLGNEQASKVTSRIRQAIVEGTDANASDVTREQVEGFRTSHPDRVSAIAQACLAEALKALDEGTIGTRTSSGGKPVDPVQAEVNRLAKDKIMVILKANGIKIPKGEGTITHNGKELAMADLVAAQIAKNGDALHAQAVKNLAAKQRELAKAKAETSELADALGL